MASALDDQPRLLNVETWAPDAAILLFGGLDALPA